MVGWGGRYKMVSFISAAVPDLGVSLDWSGKPGGG